VSASPDASVDESGPVAVVRDEVMIYDTDASGLIFFGSAARFFTRAHVVLFRQLGHRPDFAAGFATVVRGSTIELRAPLRMGDAFDSEAWVARVGRTSVTTGHRVIAHGTTCVVGTITFVHVDLATMRPSPLPEVLARCVPLGTEPAGRTAPGEPGRHGRSRGGTG
jgi:acyl-CoA thioester hydrolase